ncbi:MAG: Response regulator of zinc sigma-54-dependent two-component system [Labilithrix sp.]|nr:Response regulator of zinc sigma-54-dependent two-component system [Labilithrix sp.]
MHDRFVLVVDDNPEMARCIADALAAERCRCEIAGSGEAALAACRQHEFDVVVSDIRMSGMDGVELMARLRHVQADLPVILMTAEGSIAAAVEATKRGAFHYITKPFASSELRRMVEQAITARHSSTQRAAPARSSLPAGTEELVGSSAAMRELRARIELVAAATSPVLVNGETGTGKELVARAIHACSQRRSRPFVTVNAAAIPETLLESEMFGHVRGAFTGATQAHRGLLTEADGGTLLLDEIGDMPLGLQAKLLRVLQAGEIRAVGADRIQRVDVRIVAATHRRLGELVKEGRFREDLYYRLNVISLTVPPLRARAEDIPQLAESFLERARERAPHSPVKSISPELLALLAQGSWPGNVRELQSAIERLVVLALADELAPRHLALVDDQLAADTIGGVPSPEDGHVNGHTNGGTSGTTNGNGAKAPELCGIDELVRRHVEAVMAHTGGNKGKAAKILGVDLSTLYRWQQKWQG